MAVKLHVVSIKVFSDI